LAAVAAGCGGESDKNARGTCQGRLLDRASAGVVVRMFESGKLGSRTLVQRELGESFQGMPGGSPTEQRRLGARFFDASGHLIPYDRLSSDQQSAFNNFMYLNGRVHSLTLDAQERADDAARARFDELCS